MNISYYVKDGHFYWGDFDITPMETIDKYAWELMIIHDLSLYEARNIVIKQLGSK